MRRIKIPEVAIRRLPIYLRVLNELTSEDIQIVSSAELSIRTGFSSEQIRKDLAYFGAFGTRGVGYDTSQLGHQIRKILGLNRETRVALVGAGNLGTALARFNLAKHKDVRIVAIFDNDWDKIGKSIAGVEILPMEDLKAVAQKQQIKMAIIAVPAPEAQKVADSLTEAGIEAILNFSPAKLKARGKTYIQNIDLTIELQSLVYFTNRRDQDEETEEDEDEEEM
ncbi:MAG: redox-sensing transcriptional repressor Rex [Firmicutes bacterium]|nr:redox-sensing transcriptional repressor Rex [Bacillota bacterium]MCL5039950.1 redox-sensing transcriptional repressor Rex [Bacillota bacterium]